jgi:hypothetical protein
MILLRVTPDEQKSLVYSIDFSIENSVGIMKMIQKYLAVIHESSAC